MAQPLNFNQLKSISHNDKALCPFHGSSVGCPYSSKCELSHANPNSIELCPAYQTPEGCPNPTTCYYRHCLTPLPMKEIRTLLKKHKIAGKVHYVLSNKGAAVKRVHVVINQVLWYAVHLIIEDQRLQHMHHQKYSSIYRYDDAIAVAEFIANVVNRSPVPGKYLSFLKNLIDGDTEPGKEEDVHIENNNGNHIENNNTDIPSKSLVHYRDILLSIGAKFDEIPRPLNSHLVKNLSRVPWVDFKCLSLPKEAYDYPDIYLQPGDLVRIWRPKKFVYHCGIYLGNGRIIHISNGIDDGVGNKWGLFQSGHSSSSPSKYYDYGKKRKVDAVQELQLQNALASGSSDDDFEEIQKSEVYGDDDDMDLEGDSDLDNESDEKISEFVTNPMSGEERDGDSLRQSDFLLHQDASAEDLGRELTKEEMEQARRARECGWKEFVATSRKKDLELGYFVFPWRKPSEIVYTAKFLTEIHYMKGQYSVFKNNCEHFALYCCTGLRYSPQANAIEKITTPVIGVASKISSFAGSIFSKVSSLRGSPKLSAKDEVEEMKSENRRNHPVLQDRQLDDGGDDELEKILLDGNRHVLVMDDQSLFRKKKKRKKGKSSPNKETKVPKSAMDSGFDLVEPVNGVFDDDQKKGMDLLEDEYDDEEDNLAESMVMESNLHKASVLTDMTPGGLSQSQVMVAQKHHPQQQQWNV